MTDLDALSALLAAAKTGNHADVVVYRHRILEAAPSLIEAARREAGLREVVELLVELEDGPVGVCALCLLDSGHMADCPVELARLLLHDNAGTAER